ncbi:hypothetical protein [Paenibacillus sp. E194]|uniref:hypothetical protein n=1 Tax=Paenibacillus sp. E194 TaxID=1458845 RepID=UPI000695DB27|nr:hypothetical protein [Paenibacillus sp. E194]
MIKRQSLAERRSQLSDKQRAMLEKMLQGDVKAAPSSDRHEIPVRQKKKSIGFRTPNSGYGYFPPWSRNQRRII